MDDKPTHFIICNQCGKINNFYLSAKYGYTQEQRIEQLKEIPVYCSCSFPLDKSKLEKIYERLEV